MNIQLRTCVVLAIAGMATSAALAGPGDDHTRRGMVRQSQGGGGGSEQQNAAPAAQPSTPTPAAPAPSGSREHHDSPTPSAAPTPSIAPRSAPTHASPERVEKLRRILTPAPSPSATPAPAPAPTIAPARRDRPVVSVPLPSGADTARAHAAAYPARDSTVRSLTRDVPQVAESGQGGSGLVASGQTASNQSGSSRSRSSSPAPTTQTQRLADHTRRDLVRPSEAAPNFGGSSRHGNRNHWTNNHWNNSWSGTGTPTWNTGYSSSWAWHTSYSNSPYGWWSTGIPSTLNTFGAYGNDPWSYANWTYGGPGWNLPTTYAVDPYHFTYEPYLGADVWQFEHSPFGPEPVFVRDPVGMGGFSNGVGDLGAVSAGNDVRSAEPIRVASPSIGVKLWRVNPAYDVRRDFNASVDAALDGEFSASIYAMRRAAGLNPGAMAGPGAPLVRSIANDPESAQRVRAALTMFRNPPRRVVSETDASFMVAALSLAIGDNQGASRAADEALAAGDGAMSTELLARAIRGEPLDGDR